MMMKNKECVVKLVGRVLLAIIFIMAGFSKMTAFAGTAAYVGTVLPAPEVITALVIALELVGGLMLLVGFKTRKVACLLAAFTVLAAILYHNDFANQMQMTMFLKNLAIAGGLLYVKATGAGGYSIDAKMEKSA